MPRGWRGKSIPPPRTSAGQLVKETLPREIRSPVATKPPEKPSPLREDESFLNSYLFAYYILWNGFEWIDQIFANQD